MRKATQALNQMRVVTLVATLLTFMLIVVGAAVRVADAGVSCPDWPKCYGLWFPFVGHAGGFISEGVHYTELQVFLEWFHRLLAAVVGLFVLAMAYFAWEMRKTQGRVWRITLAALVVLLLQIKLGGLTVILDNINWSVALHLGNALIFYGLLIALLMVLTRKPNSKGIAVDGMLKTLLILTLVMVYATVLLGAMVSSSHAGAICGGLFSCNGDWWPVADHHQMLHMMHRFAAILTTLTIVAAWLQSRRTVATMAKSGRVMLIFVMVQVVLGIATLYSFTYFPAAYQVLSVTHLGWATVVFTVALAAVIKLYIGAKEPSMKGVPFH